MGKIEPAGMRFIGVDLAWGDKNPTGLAVIDDGGRLVSSALVATVDEIVDYASVQAAGECLVGVDAPLIVKNDEGCRKCETILKKRGISLYSSNRNRLAVFDGKTRGELLTDGLAELGFEVTEVHPAEVGGRLIYEVYPWSLLRYHYYNSADRRFTPTPRYKFKAKTTKEEVREGLKALVGLMSKLELPVFLEETALPYSVVDEAIDGYKRSELKAVADLIDAILSAYMVYWAHTFGHMGGEIVGDLKDGYVLVPPDVSSSLEKR